MKKLLACLLVLCLFVPSLAGCDPSGECKHIDENGTGYCDICMAPMECADGAHVDENGTGYCDICMAPMPDAPGGGSPGGEICSSKDEHADSDADGYCDKCKTSVTVVLDLYAINDLHGKFSDSDSQIGVDELTSYLLESDSRDEYSIIFSSGDMWQGSAESNMTRGNIITEWMNSLGFASMTMGNHEYDFGEDVIEENSALADFPFLAINIYDKQTNRRVDYCEASTVVRCGELSVGIIGAIGDCYSSISPDKVTGVYFKTGAELTELVKAESERLRAEGCDYIIYSLHDGYDRSYSSATGVDKNDIRSYYAAELSREGYVDIVFEGHTHQAYVLIDTYGVYHLQNGGENQGISHAEIVINYVTDEAVVNSASVIRPSVYGSYEPDPAVEELLEKYEELISPAYEVLGNNPSYLDDGELEDIVARLYYELAEAAWGDDHDIVLGGGFLRTRSPYDLGAGEVTYADIQELFPFDNGIVLCSVSGGKLKSKFINTSNSDYHIYMGSYGESIKGAIDESTTYYIVVDTYTAYYSPNGLTVVEEYDSGIYARDLLAEYIKNGGLE